jgi:hypothetical protein
MRKVASLQIVLRRPRRLWAVEGSSQDVRLSFRSRGRLPVIKKSAVKTTLDHNRSSLGARTFARLPADTT